jgi:glycerol kinase
LHAPVTTEMTAMGCGLLACLGAGLHDGPGQLPLGTLIGRIHHPRPERAQAMRRVRERFAKVVDKAKGWRQD